MASCKKKQGAYLDNGVPVRNGLVAEYRFDECRNLLKYSQQFDNAAWTKTDCAITANNIAAPDGTTTADLVTLTVGASQSIAATYAVTAATVYTYSVWVKLGTAAAAKYAVYDLTNSADIRAATSYAATTSWARYTYTFTTPAGCISISIRPVKDCAVNNGETLWLWGAQLEAGSAATTYVPTTDKQTLMDYSKPRKNLLLPNQANACEDGTTTGFVVNGFSTLTSDSTEQWQGARCLKAVTKTQHYGVYTTNVEAKPGLSYTGSVYIKGSGGAITIILKESTDADTSVGDTTINVVPDGNWTRYSLTRTFGATGRRIQLRIVNRNADETTTVYLDGLQIEEGSTATAWEAPPNIGILGSAIGTTTNDPTWTGEGAYFTTDDYDVCGTITDKAGAVQTAYSTTIVAHIPVATSAASAASGMLNYEPTSATDYGGVLLGSATGALTNEIVTLSHQQTAGYRTGWCDAVATIAVGWHTFIFNWNGASYDITIDGVKKPTTASAEGHAPLYTASNVLIGVVNYWAGGIVASNYFTGTVAYTTIYNRALTQAEITKNYAYLKSYLKKQRGISLA